MVQIKFTFWIRSILCLLSIGCFIKGNFPDSSIVVHGRRRPRQAWRSVGSTALSSAQSKYQAGSSAVNSAAQQTYQAGSNAVNTAAQGYQGLYQTGSSAANTAAQGYQGVYQAGSNAVNTAAQGYQGSYNTGTSAVNAASQGYQRTSQAGSNAVNYAQQNYQPYRPVATSGQQNQLSYQNSIYRPPVSSSSTNYYGQRQYQLVNQTSGTDPFQPRSNPVTNRQVRIACDVNEALCDQNYCFDETCADIEIESSKNGRCRCAPGYIRTMRARRCVLPRDPTCLRERPADSIPRPTQRPPLGSVPRPVFPSQPNGYPNPPPPQFGAPPKYLKSEQGPFVLLQLYNVAKVNHFYTLSGPEANNARAHGYKLEGAIGLIPNQKSDVLEQCPRELLVPLRRMYRDDGGHLSDHFYTTSDEEVSAAAALKPPYKEEGILGYCVSQRGTCGASWPLQRYYSKKWFDHFYATEHTIQMDSSKLGDYVPEGVVCYIWPYDP